MINIIRKENCTGCNACLDICNYNAIHFETDIEGFWYPKVNLDLCTDCGLCEMTCPELHIEELKPDHKKLPIVLAAYYKDFEIRSKSTSGGLFSALANKIYDEGGFVGGSVYADDFSAKHIISDKREDLLLLRGSKHFQSDMTGLYKRVNILLVRGEKVLVCGTPCQIAGLRLFLRKEYNNLVVIDFICLGINSPKIFKKYLESLEHEYGAKAISVQGKNKDLGWRSLAYRIKFANGKVYLKEGLKDNFTRGFIVTHCNCRPVCYECKYKGFPRISDISLGDFWGIENIDRTMDDNMGTSVVLLNTQKGIDLFNSIKDKIESKEVALSDVIKGNNALLNSIALPTIKRDEFYKDVDRLPFNVVVKKYYKSDQNLMHKVRKNLGFIILIIGQMGFLPFTYLKFFWINFLRKNTLCIPRKGKYIFPASHSVFDIHRKALLEIKGSMLFGYKRIKGSKMESRIAVEGNASVTINGGHVSIYYGCDILVFNGARLTFMGSATLNQNIQIICMESITIGSDVMISRDVVIRDNDGGHTILSEGYKRTAPVIIGNHVWIGQGAMILKGVTIGDGAIISAGAWVVSNVKPNTLVMNDPARTVQKNVEWIH